MKNIFLSRYGPFAFAFLFISMHSFSSCWKEDPPEPLTPLQQLPAKTREGKNTFGCLVNGEPYVMCRPLDDFLGGSVLHTDYGVISNCTYVNIYTVDRCQQDSLSRLESLDLGFAIGCGYLSASYINLNKQYCDNQQDFRHFDSTSTVNYLKITRRDESAHVLSGEFEFDLFTPNCTDTIHIRNGRFDIKI